MRKQINALSRAILMTLGVLVASCASNGSIDSGRKYGIEVGMPSEEAVDILRQRGLRRDTIPDDWGLICGGRAAGLGENLQSFTRGPNRPLICLFTASGRVVAIAWETPFM